MADEGPRNEEAAASQESGVDTSSAKAVQRVTIILLLLLAAQAAWFFLLNRSGGTVNLGSGGPSAPMNAPGGPGPQPGGPGPQPGRPPSGGPNSPRPPAASGRPAPRPSSAAASPASAQSLPPQAAGTAAPATAPRPPGPPGPEPARPGTPGPEPSGGPQSQGTQGVNLEELPQFVESVMSLENSKAPLSAAQKEKVATRAAELYEVVTGIQADMFAIVAVLDEKQAHELFAPHATGANATPPPARGGSEDPRVSQALEVLKKKAGSSPLPPGAPPHPGGGVPRVLHRPVLLDGIVWLETVSATPLSPAQARTILDHLEDMQKQTGRAQAVVASLVGDLTPEQRDMLSTCPVVPDTLAARALLLWTQRK